MYSIMKSNPSMRGLSPVRRRPVNPVRPAKEKGELTVLEVAYEMYARGFGFADADVEKSKALKFSVEDGKVLLPFAAFNGVGETAARALEEEYEKKPFETIEDAMLRAKIGRSVIDVLKEHGV